VLAASAGFSFFSVMLGAMSLFIEPLSKTFGWNRTLVSSGVSIATITTAVLSPGIGMLLDRFGTRRIALPGIVLTTASIAMFSITNGSALQWVAMWVVFGMVSSMIKSTTWTTAVVSVFEKSRGLALGLTLAGTAVAATVVPPLGNWLIEHFGWRAAYVWLGLGWGGLTLLLCLLFFFDVHDRAARHHGKTQEAASRRTALDLPGLTIPQAIRNSALWRLAIANLVVMLLTIGLQFHLFPILTEAGISRATAAGLLSLGGIAGIVGKLVSGVLLDRFRPNWIGGLTLGAAALVFAVLMTAISSPALIVIAMLVNGYAAGTNTQIVGFMTAGYAGMKNFGLIYGTMSAMLALASGLGPTVAAAIYDLTGGYEPFLAAGAAGCLLGGFIMLSLPRYPRWTKGPTRDDGEANVAEPAPL
jgi:predicted MFS family arabinose efflux permease